MKTASSRERNPRRFRVVLYRDEDGVHIAECPTLPGCVSQGRSRAAALRNIKDTISGYVASLRKHGDPIPRLARRHTATIRRWTSRTSL
ncbi:MAG: type II toxin-antitoxin system HicB family antitoxin [Planctomycetes bacterium]|nr:type II toxin-antitoxin system HicB family antitoxin [Planctomycetota bacterium]